MKKTKLTGVTLYEATDKLPAKFTGESIGRLFVGETYKVLGPCHVDATERTDKSGVKTTINEWDGILLETVKGKQFPVSPAVLQNIGFVNNGTADEPVWSVVRTAKSKAVFEDAKSLAEYRKFIKVTDTEKLAVQKFGTMDTVEKDYYQFELISNKPAGW